MARKKKDPPTQTHPPTNKSETNNEAVERIARTVFDSIISNLPSGNFSAITEIATDIEPLQPTYAEATLAFMSTESLLRDFAESRASEADALTAKKHIRKLRVRAKEYFINRIRNDTKDCPVGDILVDAERKLEEGHLSTYYRKALESVVDGCEKKIERLSKRARIREELKMFDTWPGFSAKCDLEMGKIKQLAELENAQNSQAQLPAQVYDQWQDFLYKTAERIGDAFSERDFCFEADRFLAKYPLEIKSYCWKRLVIEQQAEIASGFDGCLEFPIPAAFYEYAPKHVKFLSELQELEKDPWIMADAYVNDDAGSNEEESERAKLLASICPLFANGMPETRRTSWRMMVKFTPKQWAYFADITKILDTSTKVERARHIEEISGLTNLRTLFGKQATATDKTEVNKVFTLLKADRIKIQNA